MDKNKEGPPSYHAYDIVELVGSYIPYSSMDKERYCFLIYLEEQKNINWILSLSHYYDIEIPDIVGRRAKELILPKKTCFILVVTHIEGDTELWEADLEMIEELRKVARMTGLIFRDYIIRGYKEYYSLHESQRNSLSDEEDRT